MYFVIGKKCVNNYEYILRIDCANILSTLRPFFPLNPAILEPWQRRTSWWQNGLNGVQDFPLFFF